MATIRDLLNRIKQAKAELIANREADALRIAFDQIALVKLRIQQSGQSARVAHFCPTRQRTRSKGRRQGIR